MYLSSSYNEGTDYPHSSGVIRYRFMINSYSGNGGSIGRRSFISTEYKKRKNTLDFI